MKAEVCDLPTEELEEQMREVLVGLRHFQPQTGAWLMNALNELSDRRKAAAW